MRCPRCQQSLEAGSYHEVELSKCPGCHGLLISNLKLTPLLEAMTADLADTLQPAQEQQPLEDPGGGIACPRCGEAMDHHGYMESRLVMIDSCPGCSVVWLDTEELAAMSQMFARTTRRTEQRRIAHEQRMREMSRRFDAVLVSRAVQGRLMRGFIRRGLL
jgi:Zn-finger nucleic acid-binding protein